MGKLVFCASIAMLAVPATVSASTFTPAQAGAQLGRCIVKADRGSALSLMKTLPLAGGDIDWTSVSLGAASGCRNGETGAATVSSLRGGIAQELFKRDFVEFGVQPQRALYDLASFQLPVEKDTMGVEDPTRTLFLTADCVARSNPNGAEKLIKAEPGSAQEAKIFDSMAPWLSACQGSTRTAYGRGELRSAIVQAAYHVSARYWGGAMTYAGPSFRPEGAR